MERGTRVQCAQGSSGVRPTLSAGRSSQEGGEDFVKNGFCAKTWSEARLQWIPRRGDI